MPRVRAQPASVSATSWVTTDHALCCGTGGERISRHNARGEAATEPGHALNFAHDRKLRGAEEDCRQQGIAFLPLVAESLGGWHPCAEREVRKLGSALARHTGQLEGEAIAHLWGRLGILL